MTEPTSMVSDNDKTLQRIFKMLHDMHRENQRTYIDLAGHNDILGRLHRESLSSNQTLDDILKRPFESGAEQFVELWRKSFPPSDDPNQVVTRSRGRQFHELLILCQEPFAIDNHPKTFEFFDAKGSERYTVLSRASWPTDKGAFWSFPLRSSSGGEFALKVIAPRRRDYPKDSPEIEHLAERVVQTARRALGDERRLLRRLHSAHSWHEVSPRFIGSTLFFPVIDGSRRSWQPALIRKSVSKLRLRYWCEKTYANDQGIFRGITPVAWFRLGVEIADSIRVCHTHRVIHGFLNPDTVVVDLDPGSKIESPKLKDRKDFVRLMNFGFRWQDVILFSKMIDLKRKNEKCPFIRFAYDSPEFVPFRQPGADSTDVPPNFATSDIYAFGMIMLYLAAGDAEFPSLFEDEKQFEPNWFKATTLCLRSGTDVKEDIRRLIRKHNPAILDGNEGIVDLITHCIHPETRLRAYSIDLVIHDFRSFQRLIDKDAPDYKPRPFNDPLTKSIDDAFVGIRKAATKALGAGVPWAYSRLFNRVVEDANRTLGRLARWNLYEVSGERDQLIGALLDALGALGEKRQENAFLWAITTPTFWFDENIGSAGRFLTYLKTLAKNVQIGWLLLCDPEKRSEPRTAKIFQSLARAMKDGEPDWSFRSNQKGLYFGFREYSKERIQEIRVSRQTYLCVGHYEAEENSKRVIESIPKCDMFIAPDYVMADGRLSALRFWKGIDRVDLDLMAFPEDLRNSTPIIDFMR